MLPKIEINDYFQKAPEAKRKQRHKVDNWYNVILALLLLCVLHLLADLECVISFVVVAQSSYCPLFAMLETLSVLTVLQQRYHCFLCWFIWCHDYSGNGVLRNSSSVTRSLESGEIANMQSKLGTHTRQVYTCPKMSLVGQPTRQKVWSDTTIITTRSTSWGSPAENLCRNPLMEPR